MRAFNFYQIFYLHILYMHMRRKILAMSLLNCYQLYFFDGLMYIYSIFYNKCSGVDLNFLVVNEDANCWTVKREVTL